MESEFLPLLLITLLAVIMPVLASRFRKLHLPIVVSEILAGIIIGKSGLNIVPESATLDFLAEFGFTLLMFLSGLEVNFGSFGGHAAKGQPPRVVETASAHWRMLELWRHTSCWDC